MAKAKVDYSDVPDGGLMGILTAAHDLMLGTNAATFPGAPYTAATFKSTIMDPWEDALSKSLKGGTDRTNTKNAARATVEDALFQLGTLVNLIAKGDQAILDLSGLPSYTTDHPQTTGGVNFVPQDVRWEDGVGPGAITLRWKGDGKKSMYEVNTCTADPMVAANWTYKGSFSGGKAELNGYTVGGTVWGRVRKIGTGGQVGDWSDPAQVMVT
jgi:hypothetical protein